MKETPKMKISLAIISLLPAVLLGLLPLSVSAHEQQKPGETFRDCTDCPLMVIVPAGSFMMGSPDSEGERDNDEGPVHEVTISKPFAVGVHEVTFAEWDACVSAGSCGEYRPDDEGWGRGRRPVIYVNWDDVQGYVDWLNGKTGEARKTYRLLIESEWEYMARAGTTGRYHWGNRISPLKANYGENVDKTMPVGSYSANAFGLYDVHGNVWEWVGDCRNYSYEGAPSDASVWEAGYCYQSVVRGGSWISEHQNLRSASRHWFATDTRNCFLGFRVARAINH